MIIGFDKGSTTTKIVGLKGEKVLFTWSYMDSGMSAKELLFKALSEKGLDVSDAEKIAVTGVGAEKCDFGPLHDRITIIPEIEATGEGGTSLSGLGDAVVVSIGTGTSLAFARDGKYIHIGGSGVGSGTLMGIAKYMFEDCILEELFSLSEKGNRLNVDLTIADLFSGTDTLPPDLTASNLAKAGDQATESDWAQAMINMVLEVAGSHAALACGGYGTKNVVITGGISVTPIAKRVYDGFTRLYGLNYVIPPYSDCATAIGAARRVR